MVVILGVCDVQVVVKDDGVGVVMSVEQFMASDEELSIIIPEYDLNTKIIPQT